jgi:hypothetical protein
VKTTTLTARRLLRDSNPVPDNAFTGAARRPSGQAALAAILTSPVTPPGPGGTGRPGPKVAPRPARIRSRWRVAFPAAAMTAALAGGLAVALMLTGGGVPAAAPSAGADRNLASLVADLSVHPPAHAGDAVSVFRRLAAAAESQPSPPALGPVEYSQAKDWGLDLGQLHYNLSYHSHDINTEQSWMGSDGSSLYVSTYPGGKIPPGIIPVNRSGPSRQGQAYFAWYNPATLPAGEAAMRQHLLSRPGAYQGPIDAIVTNSVDLMSSEPLRSASRAALLRVLADTAGTSGPQARFIDMGTVTDRAGHTAIAVGYETSPAPGSPIEEVSLQVLVFDPATGVLLGHEYAYCNGQLGSQPADGSCFPTSYAQLLEVKAVSSIPATPAPSPTDTAAVPTATSPTP